MVSSSLLVKTSQALGTSGPLADWSLMARSVAAASVANGASRDLQSELDEMRQVAGPASGLGQVIPLRQHEIRRTSCLLPRDQSRVACGSKEGGEDLAKCLIGSIAITKCRV
jgi:hypothetical protein